MDTLDALNKMLFLSINATEPSSSASMITIAIFIAKYLIYFIPLGMLIGWLRGNVTQRALILKVLLATLLALGLNYCVAQLWPQPRPFVIGLGHTWLAHAPTPSFPSNHMAIFMSVGLSLLISPLKALGFITLMASLAVAWARIYLGVHFPLDMIGSVLTASFAVAIMVPLWKKMGQRVTHCADKRYKKTIAYLVSVVHSIRPS